MTPRLAVAVWAYHIGNLGLVPLQRGWSRGAFEKGETCMCGFFLFWEDVDLSTYMLVYTRCKRVSKGHESFSVVSRSALLFADQVCAGPLCKEKRQIGARTQRRSGQKFVFAAWISHLFWLCKKWQFGATVIVTCGIQEVLGCED